MAVESFRQYLRRVPDDAGTHFKLAGALHLARDDDAAIKALQGYVKLRPDDPEGHFHLETCR
jgi:predicted TPR repeat methyltransferase